MTIQAHIDALSEKRAHLKALIAVESARPMPDFVVITNLKKQNLTLKEEMQRYFSEIREDAYSTSS